MSKVEATATVTVVVEVKTASTWSAGCTIEQVQDQAAEKALLALNEHFATNDWFRIVAAPVVTVVLVKKA